MALTKLAKRCLRSFCVLNLAFAMSAAIAVPAWQINTTGQGAAGASSVSSISVGGVGFVQIQPTSQSGDFSFIENGAYQLVKLDGTPFGTNDITVTYAIDGIGNFYNPLALGFTSGTIKLFVDSNFDFGTSAGNYGADNGTLLGSFSVFGGGVNSNTGLVDLQARLNAGTLLSGYVFDAAGNDLSSAENVVLDLNVYNKEIDPESLIVGDIVCGLANYGGANCMTTPFINTPLAYIVADGGSVSLSAVPEPASSALLLAGLGLLPLSARLRRRISSIKT